MLEAAFRFYLGCADLQAFIRIAPKSFHVREMRFAMALPYLNVNLKFRSALHSNLKKTRHCVSTQRAHLLKEDGNLNRRRVFRYFLMAVTAIEPKKGSL